MSGYLSQKVDDLNSGHVARPAPRQFAMGRCASPQQLSQNLQQAILGQHDAIASVVRALTIAAAGIRDPHRPIASLLFVGPTGVGKTELARRIAAEVAGDPDKLCRIDMNSLAQEHYAASLSGAPPGYSGSKEQFTLFDRELVEGNISRPGIVLFDEVEKAHKTVLRSLLQILDTGVLTLASGTSSISFRNSIILLTSNLGSHELARQARAGSMTMRTVWNTVKSAAGIGLAADHDPVMDAVENFFDPELFNRFDEIVKFRPLGRDESRMIVDHELARLRTQLLKNGIEWEPDDTVCEFLADKGFDPVYGARNLKRVVRTQLHAPIADLVVNSDLQDRPFRIATSVHRETIIAVKCRNDAF
ncbi:MULTISPECIES: AAA family ATPase [Rhodococcus]|uniref:AAA family ATPase n=1 Tax=Rhodococcus TaxID=1827 RepID=UPI000FF14DA0|nr:MULTISPECIES: AAA family ATPase [Rhodococcus]MCW3469598.1 AAA family ATPase [Rhodococcus pyridinivorans]TWH44483.1 ClpA/ClpB-like protein [Rhodococcus rhodochrous J38]